MKYITIDNFATGALIFLAGSMALGGDASGFLLCWVVLELRSINENLTEDEG